MRQMLVKRKMHILGASLALSAMLASASATHACEAINYLDPRYLERMNSVVLDARLLSGFGMRFDKTLGKRVLSTKVLWDASPGAEVRALNDGRVIAVEHTSERGNSVLIDHGRKWKSRYSYLGTVLAKVGDCITGRRPIGTIGQLPERDGFGVGVEVFWNNNPVDPLAVRVVNMNLLKR